MGALGAIGGLLLLPAAYWALEDYGPASRVRFTPYLFDESAVKLALAVLLGLALGTYASSVARPSAPAPRRFRLAFGTVLGTGLGLLVSAGVLWLLARDGEETTTAELVGIPAVSVFAFGWAGGALLFKPTASPPGRSIARRVWAAGFLLWLGWALWPQVFAFPKNGSAEERDAWARKHMVEYEGLLAIVSSIPEIQRDLGHVTRIAPTATDQHHIGQEMDGYVMTVSLDVLGERGAGVLRLRCTLSQGHLEYWQRGHWHFQGKETRISESSLPGRREAEAPREQPVDPE